MNRILKIALLLMSAVSCYFWVGGCIRSDRAAVNQSAIKTVNSAPDKPQKDSETTKPAKSEGIGDGESKKKNETSPAQIDESKVATSANETVRKYEYAKEPSSYTFYDHDDMQYEGEIDTNMPLKPYYWSCFNRDGNMMTYTGDKRFTSRMGIDVSYYNEVSDWNQVKKAGYDFVFVRLGFRGYASEGVIGLDSKFEKHITGAKKAGLDVGVYFFSQAITDDEALEEAEFVINNLKGYTLDLPVVYDPEIIAEDGARTNYVSKEQLTQNAVIFKDKVTSAGFDAMLYCNAYWQAFKYDMGKLKDYKMWYADYRREPQTPYYFDYWQFDYTAAVDGIEGDVDLNIQLIPKEEQKDH